MVYNPSSHGFSAVLPERPNRGEDAGRALVTARPAAVAFADIVGYSILMATEERRTHARWMALLRTLIQPITTVHCGRVVDLRGDGVLAEFATAADALRWALDLQRAMLDHNRTAAETPHIVLRIGLHVGEVLAQERNIFGDAVNIAARLQEQAQPGGIALSQPVLDQADAGLAGAVASARDLGLLELKNIARPIRIHAIDTYAQRVALPLPRPSPHALPSIAVLPLHNLGGDPADDYLADGVVEDIVVSLAALRELFVIARTSTLVFRGAEPDPRQLGRALGVRYVLMGSIRRRGAGLRISVQLCETQGGGTLWGDRIDAGAEQLFEVQDAIVRRVVAGIAPNVRSAELARAMRQRPESFTAYDHTLKALAGIHSLFRDVFDQARDHLAAAMTEDPDFAMPVAWAARWHGLRVGQGWSPDPAQDARAASALAQRAIELDPQNALALATYGHLRVLPVPRLRLRPALPRPGAGGLPEQRHRLGALGRQPGLSRSRGGGGAACRAGAAAGPLRPGPGLPVQLPGDRPLCPGQLRGIAAVGTALGQREPVLHLGPAIGDRGPGRARPAGGSAHRGAPAAGAGARLPSRHL